MSDDDLVMSKYIHSNELVYFVLNYYLEGDDDHAFVFQSGGSEIKTAKTEEEMDEEITHREFEFGGDTWICTKTEMNKLSDDGTFPDHNRVEGTVVLSLKDDDGPSIRLSVTIDDGIE